MQAVLGSIVRLRAPSAGESCRVVAPDGLVLFPNLGERRSFELWVPQLGTWSYSWDDDIDQYIEVIAAPEEDEPDDPGPVRSEVIA